MGRSALAEKAGKGKTTWKMGNPSSGEQSTGTVLPSKRIRKPPLNLKSCLGWAEGQPLSFEDWGLIAGYPSNMLAL